MVTSSHINYVLLLYTPNANDPKPYRSSIVRTSPPSPAPAATYRGTKWSSLGCDALNPVCFVNPNMACLRPSAWGSKFTTVNRHIFATHCYPPNQSQPLRVSLHQIPCARHVPYLEKMTIDPEGCALSSLLRVSKSLLP